MQSQLTQGCNQEGHAPEEHTLAAEGLFQSNNMLRLSASNRKNLPSACPSGKDFNVRRKLKRSCRCHIVYAGESGGVKNHEEAL